MILELHLSLSLYVNSNSVNLWRINGSVMVIFSMVVKWSWTIYKVQKELFWETADGNYHIPTH